MKLGALCAMGAMLAIPALADVSEPLAWTDAAMPYMSILSLPAGAKISIDIVGLKMDCPPKEQE